MRRKSRTGVVVLAVCCACTRSPQPAVPTVVVRCSVRDLASVDSSWVTVRAAGFTFCVPGSWSSDRPPSAGVDSKRWHGDGSSVAWDLGRPRSMVAPDVRFTVSGTVVTVTKTAPIPPANLSPPAVRPEPCGPTSNAPFLIGSVSIVVTQVKCQETWTTTAWSTAPAMFVQGEAHGASGAELLSRIMETIRFTAPGH